MSIYQREDDLDRLLVQLNGILLKCESYSGNTLNEKYSEGILIYERAKCAESAYIEQIESLQSKSKATQLKKLDEKQSLMYDLKSKLNDLKTIINEQQSALLDHGDPAQNLPYSTKLIVWGNELQDKTQESINRIRDLTIESEKIGVDVTADLEAQNESLTRVKSTIENVDENIIYAKYTLKAIAKGVLRDKFTIILIFIILLLIGGIVLLVYANKSKEEKTKDAIKQVITELSAK